MPSLSKLPSGRWRVAVKHGRLRRTGTADTKNEARRLGHELALELGGTIDDRTATVADVLAVAVVEREARWSPTYRAEVLAVVDRLPDTFVDRRAARVTPVVVAALYRQLERDGWAPSRIRRAHEVMSAAWSVAAGLELVDGNPFAAVPKPPARRRPLTIPTHAQVAAIVAAGRTDVERVALRLAATLGVRRGEVVALTWDDVDVDRAAVVIRRSLAYTPAVGVVERGTKTGEAGHRVLALDLPTVAALRRLRAAQLELAIVNPGRAIVPRFVFSDDAGVTAWRPDRLTHLFAACRKRAGVAGVRLHDLRHYVATTMLEDGVEPHDVAGQLGHTSLATTLSVYAHHLPGRGRESVERRAARLDNVKRTQ